MTQPGSCIRSKGNTSVMKKIAGNQLALVIFYAIYKQILFSAIFNFAIQTKDIYDFLLTIRIIFFSTPSFFNNFSVRLLHYVDCDRNVASVHELKRSLINIPAVVRVNHSTLCKVRRDEIKSRNSVYSTRERGGFINPIMITARARVK